MNNSMKYVISAVFVTIGLLILTYGELHYEEKGQDLSEPLNSLNVRIDLQVFSERISHLTLQDSVDIKILPLIILTPNVCLSCLSNVVEYTELLKENSYFYEPTLIFIDQDKEIVERFLLTSQLNIPFELLKAEDLDPLLNEMEKNLIFVDPHEQEVFYNTELSNRITNLVYKEELLNEVLITSKVVLESDNRVKVLN